MQSSLACKLSTTSSNNDTVEGIFLFIVKFILKSLASLEAPGKPTFTKNAKGNVASATDVLKLPPLYWVGSVTYWKVAVIVSLESIGEHFLVA